MFTNKLLNIHNYLDEFWLVNANNLKIQLRARCGSVVFRHFDKKMSSVEQMWDIGSLETNNGMFCHLLYDANDRQTSIVATAIM